jgi:hypothetical protein
MDALLEVKRRLEAMGVDEVAGHGCREVWLLYRLR